MLVSIIIINLIINLTSWFTLFLFILSTLAVRASILAMNVCDLVDSLESLSNSAGKETIIKMKNPSFGELINNIIGIID